MYEIVLTKQSAKDLEKTRKGDRRMYRDIRKALSGLAADPYRSESIELAGREGRRLSVRQYRIIYGVVDMKLLVEVLRIGQRRDIYQK